MFRVNRPTMQNDLELARKTAMKSCDFLALHNADYIREKYASGTDQKLNQIIRWLSGFDMTVSPLEKIHSARVLIREIFGDNFSKIMQANSYDKVANEFKTLRDAIITMESILQEMYAKEKQADTMRNSFI